MRLLNTKSWLLEDFIADESVPRYAILSHTWLDEEVTFTQWQQQSELDISKLKGYRKIRSFGSRAAEDNFEWVWVDTYVPIAWLYTMDCTHKTQVLYRQDQ